MARNIAVNPGKNLRCSIPPLPSPPLSFPSLFLPFLHSSCSLPLLSHSLPLSYLPLEVGPLIKLGGLWKHCQLPQWGLGQKPSWNRIWCILALKSDIWWVVATILIIFLIKFCAFKTVKANQNQNFCQCHAAIWIRAFGRPNLQSAKLLEEQEPDSGSWSSRSLASCRRRY